MGRGRLRVLEKIPDDLYAKYTARELTQQQLAEALNVSFPTVRHVLLRMGHVPAWRGPPKKFFVGEEEITAYMEGRCSIRQIAKRIGCSPATVQVYMTNDPRYRSRVKAYFPGKRFLGKRVRLEARRNRIAGEYLAGASCHGLAEKHNLTTERICQIVRPVLQKLGLHKYERIMQCKDCGRDMLIRSIHAIQFVTCPDCTETKRKKLNKGNSSSSSSSNGTLPRLNDRECH